MWECNFDKRGYVFWNSGAFPQLCKPSPLSIIGCKLGLLGSSSWHFGGFLSVGVLCYGSEKKKKTLLSFEDAVPLFSTLQPLIGGVILLTEPFEIRPPFFSIQAPLLSFSNSRRPKHNRVHLKCSLFPVCRSIKNLPIEP